MTDEQRPGHDEPTQAIPAAAMIGDRYRLDALVGRGGTAEVWQAQDTSLDRTVALKLVTIGHDESSARAADEARTLARLSHPSLVQVYDAGTDDAGRPWVVMEFVDGETLADAVRRGPLSVQRITEIGTAVADALDHVHARGMVHRDVKPANVLLGRGGKTKLTDFGIARLVDAAKVTSTGLLVGTASYLAPEQVNGQPVGPAADVYALGLVLLEALTGKREYAGPAVEAAMARLHRPPVIPATLPAGWPALLQAMTAREATDRPSAAEVARVLRALSGGDTTTVLPQRTTTIPVVEDRTRALPQPRPVPVAPARSSRGKIWAFAGVVVVLLGIGGFAATRTPTLQPAQIAPVSPTVPAPLRTDLENFVQQVPQ